MIKQLRLLRASKLYHDLPRILPRNNAAVQLNATIATTVFISVLFWYFHFYFWDINLGMPRKIYYDKLR